jgi:hypothetical protein
VGSVAFSFDNPSAGGIGTLSDTQMPYQVYMIDRGTQAPRFTSRTNSLADLAPAEIALPRNFSRDRKPFRQILF